MSYAISISQDRVLAIDIVGRRMSVPMVPRGYSRKRNHVREGVVPSCEMASEMSDAK